MTITTASQLQSAFQLQSATRLTYKPRNTSYRVLHHDVRIKQPDGSWKLGCVYECPKGNLYTRPYDMFDDRWEVIEK